MGKPDLKSVVWVGLAAALGLLIAGCGGPSATAGLPELPDPTYGGGDFLQILRHQDSDRGYVVHVPATARPEVPAPLLIVLHGAGQSDEGIRRYADLEPVTDPEGWITVYPAGIEQVWAVGSATRADIRGIDDVGFIRRMIDRIGRSLNIDRDRVFAAGLSNGAVFSHRLGCELSDKIAGIASVAATILSHIADDCAPSRPVAALFFLGDRDGFFPWDGFQAADGFAVLGADATLARWAEINGCGAPTIADVPDASEDGTTVELRDYVSCARAPVRFFAIRGGGHTWPGAGAGSPFGRTTQDIDANTEILEFFSTFDR